MLSLIIAAIQWDVDPAIFQGEVFGLPLNIRWYGLLFALGFICGQMIMSKIYQIENRSQQDLETLLMYMVIAVVVGARLGHCLFYQPEIYLKNPIEILKIWNGGLASHGGAAGILLSIWLYSRKRPDQPYLWVLDRIVITIALAACFIRFGNLMNSEIIGKPTDMPWGFVFAANGSAGLIPRHPAQLYESLSSLLLFFILIFLYSRTKERTPHGRLLGIFMIWIFGLRFVYEFLKENQVAFEDEIMLNMGQNLSIPLIIAGVILVWRSYTKPKITSVKTEGGEKKIVTEEKEKS